VHCVVGVEHASPHALQFCVVPSPTHAPLHGTSLTFAQ